MNPGDGTLCGASTLFDALPSCSQLPPELMVWVELTILTALTNERGSSWSLRRFRVGLEEGDQVVPVGFSIDRRHRRPHLLLLGPQAIPHEA